MTEELRSSPILFDIPPDLRNDKRWNRKKLQKTSKSARKWINRFLESWLLPRATNTNSAEPCPPVEREENRPIGSSREPVRQNSFSPGPTPSLGKALSALHAAIPLLDCSTHGEEAGGPAREDGFIVLNGGTLASSSPYEVRQLLLDSGVVESREAEITSKDAQTDSMLYFGVTLPFVLVARPLRRRNRLVSLSNVPLMSGEGETSSCSTSCASSVIQSIAPLVVEREEAGNNSTSTADCLPQKRARTRETSDHGDSQHRPCAGAAKVEEMGTCTPCSGFTMRVYLLPVPEHLRSATHQSTASSNSMADALLLVPCCSHVVLSHLGHLFQPRVIGIERVMMAAAASTSEAGPLKGEVKHVEEGLKVAGASDNQRVVRSTAIAEIPGLYVVHDFLTTDEHDSILQEMQARSQLQLQYLQRRRVAHFNRRFIYGVNKVDEEGVEVNPNPKFFDTIQRRLHNRDPQVSIVGPLPDFGDRLCDQLTVNYYDYSDKEGRSCGIAPHVDAHSAFMDHIYIVSLGSYTLMEFRRWDMAPDAAAAIPVYLEPRSLVIMSGESRYGWEHAIAEKRTDILSERLPPFHRGDRVSLTWRVARDGPHFKDTCSFPALCDGILPSTA